MLYFNQINKQLTFFSRKGFLFLGIMVLAVLSSFTAQGKFANLNELSPLSWLLKMKTKVEAQPIVNHLKDTKQLTIFAPQIEANTDELIFSAIDQSYPTAFDPSSPEHTIEIKSITVQNTGNTNLNISSASLIGSGYSLSSNHSFPEVIASGQSQDFEIRFAPGAGNIGRLDGSITFVSNDVSNPSLVVNLYGISTAGFGGYNEPTLSQVVDALGYNINVGWTGLTPVHFQFGSSDSALAAGLINMSTDLAGEEVDVQTFKKSGNNTVTLTPVARYSPVEPLPTGWYTNNNGTSTLNQTFVLSGQKPEHQTLLPKLLSGNTQFDPGTAAFGIYIRSAHFGRDSFTEDALNTPSDPPSTAPGTGSKHRVRTYPLKNRQGNLVPNQYLICFEDANNGDYQDYMYVLSGVKPSNSVPEITFKRINSNGPNYTDAGSNVWAADNSFSGGLGSSKTFNVAGTTEDDLFRTYRYGNNGAPFSYNIPVSEDGIYTVRLLMMEPYFGAPGGGVNQGGPGRRVFSANIENGQGLLTNYDLNADVGPATASIKTFSGITVNDGVLNINFTASVNSAIVSAIEVSGPQPVSLLFQQANNTLTLPVSGNGSLNNTIITNNGINNQMVTLNALDASSFDPVTWLTINGSPLNNLSFTTNTNFDFEINATGLTSGTYTASITATAGGYEAANFEITLTVTPAQSNEAFFSGPTPANGAIGVAINGFQITVLVNTPVDYELTNTTLTGNVNLYEVVGANEVLVPSNSNDTGGGDAITLTPSVALKPLTTYRLRLAGVEANRAGVLNDRIIFQDFVSNFTTATNNTGGSTTLTGVSFTKVTGTALGTGINDRFTSLEIGPDGKLYGSTVAGQIKRWNINANGTLANLEVLTPVLVASPNPETGVTDTNPRLIIGFTFDKNATAGNLIAYITHNAAVLTNGPNWDGKITQLSGPNLSVVKDLVINLPRSTKDHLTNSIVNGPDGALYISQGSNTAGGDPDAAWGNRIESLLAGAILKLDLEKLPEAQWPLNVYTTSDIAVINNASATSMAMSDGTYNPYANTSPLTIFSSGIRNAYDLVWHSNGTLYAPTNGTAGNNTSSPNTPASDTYVTATNGNRVRRTDGTFYEYPAFPNVPAVRGGETQKDWLFKVSQGSYHGHPNPYQGHFVLNHGGITYNGILGQTTAHKDVAKYAASVLPDPSYVEPVFDFGFNKSPNGAIEYKSNAFGGVLKNKLLVVRFSGQKDIIALEPDNLGNITAAYTGIAGFTGFIDPLELVEDTRNGNIYIAQYDRNGDVNQQIVLLRADVPATDAPEIIVNNVLRISNPITDANATTQNLLISNDGNIDLEISNIAFTGAKASKFSLPNGQTSFTIPSGSSINVPIAFNATVAGDLGTNIANLVITSNHLGNTNFTTTVSLRGLGTQGSGGTNEPSLQAILDVYNIPVNVGDDNPSTNVLHGSIQDGSLLGEEVSIQKFEKASTNPVTVELLAVYGPTGTNPIVNFGWYQSGNIASGQAILSVANTPTSNGQTINPISTGTTSFDLGIGVPFGFFSEWPFFSNRKIYSEDALNTFSGAIPHHVRVYPMKSISGDVIPNQYIVAFEEHTTGFDYQDIILLVKNVKPYVESVLPSIVFTPSTRNVIVEVGGNTDTWFKLDVPGATTTNVTFTAIDPATGQTPTWLKPKTGNWGESLTYNSTLNALPFDVTSAALPFGDHQATITASAAGYSNGTMTIMLSVVPLINWTYNINFQMVGNTIPAGFFSDTGLPFQTQVKNGQSYDFGWVSPINGTPKDNTGSARFRNIAGINQEVRTLNQFQRSTSPGNQSLWANWQINIPNNTYYVEVASGDTFFNSEHKVDVEGVEVLNFPLIATVTNPTVQQSTFGFAKAIGEVNVADGTLNLSPIGNGNTKISYIKIGTPGLANIRLGFTPSIINETALFGSGVNIFNTTLTATAGSPTNINLEVISGSTWLSVPATSGVGSLNLTANVTNLSVGTYQGRIRATLPGYQSVILDVNLEVLPQSLTFNKQTLFFNVNQGGTTAPQTAIVSVTGGNAALTLSKTSGVAWLNLPTNPTTGVAQNYTITANGLAPGIYTAQVKANAQGFNETAMTVILKVMAAPINTWAYKINFQKDPTPLPAGYIPDLGNAFGTRTFGANSYEFGWISTQDGSPYNNTAQARRRTGNPEELRTLNHMQFSSTERSNWEMTLPNGMYDVVISVGETQFFNSHHTILVEGQYFMDFNQAIWNVSQNHLVQRTVEVTDGKLTINGQTGVNTKIQYIWIRPTNPANDDIAPTVQVNFEGIELSQDVYKNKVVVRALPSDQGGSGVALTEFSLNNGVSWQTYTNSLIIDEQGIYSITFRVTDGKGNTVQTPIYNFRVNQVPLNSTKMVLENRDKFPENDELSFHRIQEEGWAQSGGGTAEFHDFVTLRVNNRGQQPLRIFDLIISNEAYWAIQTINGLPYSSTSLPLTVPSNQFVDLGMKFIAVNPPNPRSNGIKVLHETLTIISNDDEMPNKEVKLHGLWQRRGEGGNEPMTSEILDAFGLTIDIAFPSPNFKDGDDFSVAGDEIYTNNFLRANPSKPVQIRQLAAYHGCCDGGAGSWTQENNPDANGGRVGNVGTRRTNHIGEDSQTLLPRKDRTGPVGTLGDPAEGEFNPNGKFNVTLGGRDCINPALNFQQLVGTRIWKLRNSKGEIVPFAFILANDYLSGNANFDYNDNVFLITNVRPEFGTGYASLLATGNGVVNDPAEKQSDLEFGQIAINNTNTKTLNLRSLGQTFAGDDDPDIVISFVEIVGQDRAEFFASSPTKTVLKPSEATTMQVNFNPSEFGVKQATLLIHYNSEDSPMRVPLYGIATSACNGLVLSRKIKAATDDANPVMIAGEQWESDVPFRVAGINYKLDVFNSVQVALTDKDGLYNRYMSSQGSQNGRRIEYAIPLVNGEYTVRLHFAEIFWQNINSRVNNILIEGQTVIEGFDAFNEIGEKSAIVKDFRVTVTDGILNLRFNPIVDRPSIGGIEIFQFDDASPIGLQLVSSTNADCSIANGSIEVVATGNINPVMYKLGKFGTYQTSPIFTGLLPSQYTIYVKEDVADACESEATFTIGEKPSAITFNINLTSISCGGGNNGAAQLQNILGGTAPYRIFWNGNPAQGTSILENLGAGDYSVEVFDVNNCSVTQNFTITSEANCPTTVRINAGGSLYTTTDGRVFIADTYFSTPSDPNFNNAAIAGTPDQTLYKTHRWRNGNLFYNIPVTPGTYEVTLHFAETYGPNNAVGMRIFDVNMEGNTVIDNFDPVAAAGGQYRAVFRTIRIEITDGNLDLDFIKGAVENPMVSAIEIVPYVPTVNLPPIVNQTIPNQSVDQGIAYTYQVSTFAFLDGDDATLTLSAQLANGNPLPSWLTFNPVTRRFTGTASTSDIGNLEIRITATDSEGQFVSQTFNLNVKGLITVVVSQDNRPLIAGSSDKTILSIQITGTAGQQLTAMTFNTNGTSVLSNIENAKIYSTTLPIFRGGQSRGGVINNPSGQFTITGLNYILQTGVNQLWLVYDVADNAEQGNLLDAEVTNLTIDGTAYPINNGTPVGARVVRSTENAPGKLLVLDGIDDYAVINGEGYFDFENEFSVELWMKVGSFNKNNQAIITKGNTAWRLQRFGNTNQIQFVINGVDNIVSTTAFNDNQWHRISATYNGSTMILYIDGKPEAQKVVTGTPVLNNVPVWIGANAEVPNISFNGEIDEVGIWKKARLQNEIRESRHLTFKGNEEGLLAYFQFNETIGALAEDFTDGFNATLTNINVGVARTDATEPVGRGVSFRANSQANATIAFGATGFSVTFGANHPSGEIVITKIVGLTPSGNDPAPGKGKTSDYWVVNNYGNDAGLSPMSFTFTLPSQFMLSVNTEDYKLYKRGDNDYQSWTSNFVASSINNNDLTFNGITGFSQVIIAGDGISLPVSLLSFTGNRLNESEVDLKWATISEEDNVGFEVQKSENATDFTTIGFVEGAGNSIQLLNYAYIDIDASESAYYRLKQIDSNGDSSFSNIIYVKGEEKESTITVYPNPYDGFVPLTVKASADIQAQDKILMQVLDMRGTIVIEAQGNLEKLQAQLNQSLNNVAAGQYLVRFFTVDKNYIIKMIKK